MKRDMDALDLRGAFAPPPEDCRRALMDAARSVKEGGPVKRAPFRAVWIAAMMLVGMMAAALAAHQMGWVDFYGAYYGIAVPKAAEEMMNQTEPLSFEVGPMTFTYRQLLTDGRIALGSAEVHMTDGGEALIANGADLHDSVDALSDTIREQYGLQPGVTWVEAAKQLNLPLYGVRALVEVAPEYDGGGGMEDALWNGDGSIVYFSMPSLNREAVQGDLPATLYMAVHRYDPESGEVQVNAWTARREAVIPAAPLLAERTYRPDGEGQVAGIGMTRVQARQYATGIYLTGACILPDGMDEGAALETLYGLTFCDEDGTALPMGLSLSGEADVSGLPLATLEVMTSAERLPDSLIVTDGATALRLR